MLNTLEISALVLAMVTLLYWATSKLIAEHRQRKAFLQGLYQLTPYDKPFFAYNRLQYDTYAFTTFDKLTGQGAKRIEIAYPVGDKLLANKTASITLVGNDQRPEELFNHLTARIMRCKIPNLDSASNSELWGLARTRLFRLCEDLYVQIGTKVPPGTTRTEIEHLNTRCYSPSEVWETLEADVTQAIQSRTQAG